VSPLQVGELGQAQTTGQSRYETPNQKGGERVKITIDPVLQDRLPVLTREEKQTLEELLKREGCRDALVVWKREGVEDPILLDGHHRYEICTRLGLPFEIKELKGCTNLETAASWILANDNGRRHKTPSQRAAAAVKLEELYAEEAKKRRQATQNNKGKDSVPVKLPEQEKGEARDKAAKDAGASPRYVQDAKKIKEEAPETFEKMKEGEITMAQAKKEVAAKRSKEPVKKPSQPKRKPTPKGGEIYRDGFKIMVKTDEEHLAWYRPVHKRYDALCLIGNGEVTPSAYLGMLPPHTIRTLNERLAIATAWINEMNTLWQERRKSPSPEMLSPSGSQLLH